MHFKSDISSCWLIPSNRVSSVANNTEAGKRVSATESLLLLKSQTMFKSQTIRRYILINSKSTENDIFIQSITNGDVLANNIRIVIICYAQYSILQEVVHRPPTAICLFRRATVNVINFPNSGQTGLVSFNELLRCGREFSFQYNGLLYCRACVRSEAYTVLFARKRKSFFRTTSQTLILTESTSDQSAVVVVERSSNHKQYYPPQFKHPSR